MLIDYYSTKFICAKISTYSSLHILYELYQLIDRIVVWSLTKFPSAFWVADSPDGK